jgi:hypothetical protein
MGLYRDENGLVFEVDDNFAAAHGYQPVAPEEEAQQLEVDAQQARGEQRGALGTLNANLTGIASGMTLGGTDYLLGKIMTPLEREQLNAEINAHPYARAGGEIGGQIASTLVGGGRVTPTGYLSNLTAQEAERGLVQGGIKGTAKALGAMGAEGALNNAGAYLGRTALEDTDITAEGLGGALGTGFAFGAAGGGAVLGVSKGTIAARRMFSRFADTGGEKAAESAWSLASQEALDADIATANEAKRRLQEMSQAKAEALKYKQQQDSLATEESIRASMAEKRPSAPADPDAELMKPAKGGGQTSVFQRPKEVAPVSEFDGPTPLDEGIAPARDGQQTSISNHVFGNEETKVIPREAKAVEAPTELEGKLAGTKAELDSGKSLNEIKASKGNASNEIEKGLAEKKAYDDFVKQNGGDRTGVRNMGPEMPEKLGPKPDGRKMMSVRKQMSKQLLGEAREDLSTELLGKPFAKQETELTDAVKEFESAHDELMKHVMRDINDNTKVVRKSSMSAAKLDEAYETALDQVRTAETAAERGAALQSADEIESMLEKLSPKDINVQGSSAKLTEDFFDQKKIDAIKRYEEASAKLADVVGDGAHPTSVLKAKALKDAEKDAERKLFDRTARATDDAATYGPEYMEPKQRVAYARKQALEAKKALDEAKAGHASAKEAHAEAQQRVSDGNKAKKSALRADAKVQREAARAAARSEKAAATAGALEFLDIPGLPKPSDLPVVGPLLGAYLKFRAVKTAFGRLGGRLPATADARVAALASRTRDRVARAIDRSLGLAKTAAPQARKALPALTSVVARRIYDDGGEHPTKNAPITEHVAARARELAAYVNTPGAIEKDVRIALQDVTDPDLIAAAEKQRRAAMEFLLSKAPKMPEQGPLQRMKWLPSPAQAMSFARTMEAVDDPAGVYERLAHERDMISLEAAEALRVVYPQMFQMGQQRLLERATEIKTQVPTRTRYQLSLLYKMPLDSGLQPDNFKIAQSVYERSTPAQPAPTAMPTPAIASDTNLTALYQTTADRRAMR